jgi:hypothetical protein
LTGLGIACYFIKYFDINDWLIATVIPFPMAGAVGRRDSRGGERSAADNLL